jgi:hypothetical protein
MKTFLTLLSLFTIIFSLSGQSHLIKIGGNYRNTDYLSHTGNQNIGPQVGYNYRVSEKLTLVANVGYVSDYWEVRRSNLLVFKEQERTNYLEVMALFPILRGWAPAGNLKAGIGYIGSRTTFEYSEMAVIRNQQLESNTTTSLTSYLHELGVVLEYVYPLSNHFVLHASGCFSASLNRASSYQSTMLEYYSSGGTSRALTSLEERNTAHYRLAVGVGYLF